MSLGGPVWLASDIHLGSHNPRTSDAFYKFLAHARRQSSALILLGDIFDAWIGDDWIRQPPDWLQTALDHLQLTANTIPLWLMGGNRDFLIGAELAQSLGAHLIESPCVLEVVISEAHPSETTNATEKAQTTQRFLLAHGDEFCTADRAYQRFRSVVRNHAVQRLFLTLPLTWRTRIASRARASSMQTVRSPYDASYDAQDEAIAKRLVQTGLSTCIHGHTHRPGTYPVLMRSSLANRSTSSDTMTRWVLPDWECDHLQTDRHETCPDASQQSAVRGGWIQIDQQGPRLIDLGHSDLLRMES